MAGRRRLPDGDDEDRQWAKQTRLADAPITPSALAQWIRAVGDAKPQFTQIIDEYYLPLVQRIIESIRRAVVSDDIADVPRMWDDVAADAAAIRDLLAEAPEITRSPMCTNAATALSDAVAFNVSPRDVALRVALLVMWGSIVQPWSRMMPHGLQCEGDVWPSIAHIVTESIVLYTNPGHTDQWTADREDVRARVGDDVVSAGLSPRTLFDLEEWRTNNPGIVDRVARLQYATATDVWTAWIGHNEPVWSLFGEALDSIPKNVTTDEIALTAMLQPNDDGVRDGQMVFNIMMTLTLARSWFPLRYATWDDLEEKWNTLVQASAAMNFAGSPIRAGSQPIPGGGGGAGGGLVDRSRDDFDIDDGAPDLSILGGPPDDQRPGGAAPMDVVAVDGETYQAFHDVMAGEVRRGPERWTSDPFNNKQFTHAMVGEDIGLIALRVATWTHLPRTAEDPHGQLAVERLMQRIRDHPPHDAMDHMRFKLGYVKRGPRGGFVPAVRTDFGATQRNVVDVADGYVGVRQLLGLVYDMFDALPTLADRQKPDAPFTPSAADLNTPKEMLTQFALSALWLGQLLSTKVDTITDPTEAQCCEATRLLWYAETPFTAQPSTQNNDKYRDVLHAHNKVGVAARALVAWMCVCAYRAKRVKPVPQNDPGFVGSWASAMLRYAVAHGQGVITNTVLRYPWRGEGMPAVTQHGNQAMRPPVRISVGVVPAGPIHWTPEHVWTFWTAALPATTPARSRTPHHVWHELEFVPPMTPLLVNWLTDGNVTLLEARDRDSLRSTVASRAAWLAFNNPSALSFVTRGNYNAAWWRTAIESLRMHTMWYYAQQAAALKERRSLVNSNEWAQNASTWTFGWPISARIQSTHVFGADLALLFLLLEYLYHERRRTQGATVENISRTATVRWMHYSDLVRFFNHVFTGPAVAVVHQ